MKLPPARSIDNYISGFPVADVRERLAHTRFIIQQAAPAATEAIEYGMPCFVLHDNLVYFAAFNKHISLFSVPVEAAELADMLVGYKTGKGSVQFPLNQPLPLELIAELVGRRVQQQQAKAAARS